VRTGRAGIARRHRLLPGDPLIRRLEIRGAEMGGWDGLGKRLKILRVENREGIVHEEDGIVWKATPEILDWFEEWRKFKLPDDFRDFACTFGPGKIGTGEWCFYVPGIDWESEPESLDLLYLLDYWENTQKGRNLKLTPFCDKREAERFSSGGVEGRWTITRYFGWNLQDVTDPARHEYGIYEAHPEREPAATGKAGPRGRRVRLASTFREFVLDYALAGDLGRRGEASGADDPDESGNPGSIPFRQTRF
jgi:hypothetical protein